MTDPTLAMAMDFAKAMKREAVAQRGVGADIVPMLDLRRDGTCLGIAVLEGGRDRLLALCSTLVALSGVDRVIFMTDAYGTSVEADDADEVDLEVGELAQRFPTDPGVYECLQVLTVDRDGNGEALSATYRYRGTRLVWSEPEPHRLELAGGAVTKRIIEGFRHQVPVPASFDMTRLFRLVDCTVVMPT